MAPLSMPSVDLKGDSNLYYHPYLVQVIINSFPKCCNTSFSSNSRRNPQMQSIKECNSAIFFSYSFFVCVESTYGLTERLFHLLLYFHL